MRALQHVITLRRDVTVKAEVAVKICLIVKKEI